MISDDLVPYRSVGSAHQKNMLWYHRTWKTSQPTRGQSPNYNPQQASQRLPAAALGLPIRKSCLFNLDSLYAPIKIKKVV